MEGGTKSEKTDGGKSCYVLELSVESGGSQWAETHTYTRPKHLRLILEEFCKNNGNDAAYHAIYYGATLGLWVVQRGTVGRFIDLHPFLSVDLGEDGGLVTLDRRDVLDPVAKRTDDEDDWGYYDRLKLELDWPAIQRLLPALEVPLLERGETTPIQGIAAIALPKRTIRGYPDAMETHLRHIEELWMGSFEHLNAGNLAPPFDLDD